jgi:hypothetical protein
MNKEWSMKKPVAITIACLFSITLLLSGAFSGSDCAVRCADKMTKAHPQASMGSAGLVAPTCCSGTMKNTCQMGGTPEIKIPVCSMSNHPTGVPDPASIGLLSIIIDADALRASRTARQSQTGHINKTPPLYLQTLTLLC